MSNIGKQAVQAVADLKAGYTLGHADVAILNELARIALASLEAEPVCVIDQSNLDYLKSGSDADVWPASRTEMGDVLLYSSAPPAPVSVPDDVLKGLLPDAEKAEFWFEHNGKILFEGVKFNNAVFDACRAAMLQPSSGALQLPQWIPCSERMPEVKSTVLVYMNEPQHSATDYAVADFDKYGFSRSKVTHWMPLPAAPQEPTK
ncbi:DUF551 domain-containing protein [Enterobacter hormaechei]